MSEGQSKNQEMYVVVGYECAIPYLLSSELFCDPEEAREFADDLKPDVTGRVFKLVAEDE